MNKKVFRWHRGGLAESLETTIEVSSISDMTTYILEDYQVKNYLHNIRISEQTIDDSARSGALWEKTHRVLADFEEYTGQCIGYCNFIADDISQEFLEEAIKLATKKHSGQVDKGNMPYILHPLRVMLDVQKHADRNDNCSYWNMCIAAVLHDVIEDTPITPEELSAYGFDQETIDTISLLTKTKEESYLSYIHRISDSGNREAIFIKLADLRDNLNKSRLPQPLTDKDLLRIEKYKEATKILEEALVDKMPG